ncbi:efflux RND transporter periplasmic adaptor subunit [Marinobacterium jannaschii]|uniref:efflux RND transporter periplasmic adaptor subunit n=1 Tax=Marinobacterium jannaschii TaxID=64970 RepID=UPI0004846477|nr:HlyD family efflux transporter periplasmic adaptor subunit [Marinobacterium jannaschii]
MTRKSPRSFLKWLLPLLFIAAAVAVFIVLKNSKPETPARPVTERSWRVSTVAAAAADYQPQLEIYGTVEAPRKTTFTAAVTAFVNKVDTDEGRQVRAGEQLLQLDPRDTQLVVTQREADVAAIKARISAEQVRYKADREALKIEQKLLAISQRSVDRFERLLKRKVGSEDQLDNARRTYQQQALALNSRRQSIADHPNRLQQLKSELQRAAAQLDSARLDLQRTTINAGFDARIAKLYVAPGDRVRSGDKLVSLYDLERLELRAQIPTRFLATIRAALQAGGLKAELLLPDRSLPVELDRLAGEVDGGRGGVDALFRFIEQPDDLEPGRALSLRLQLPAVANSYALPPQALYGLDRIYRVQDGRLQSVRVNRVGSSRNSRNQEQVLVTSIELHENDRILATQLPNAINGLRVEEAN